MHSDIIPDDFISQLVDDGLLSVPWQRSTFIDDFIMLAEFSEMEGPKNIFTIPRDLNCKFDLDAFAVRIMSVDCVSILQTSDMSSFNIAGDIQVVLSEMSEGAVAYVHHFVLYDIRARGYVRPYCLAYITRNHTRLMDIFESLLQYFSFVSSLFHFGNAMNFINDLVTRWQQLHYLNTILADKTANIYVDDKLLSVSQKESIMEKDIDENLSQLIDLQKVFLTYLDKDSFSEHRDIFHHRYRLISSRKIEPMSREETKTLTRDDESITNFPEYNDGALTDFGLTTNSHDIPEDVIGSLLGKKYDKPLRQLNELCDVTYNSGLHTLKCTLKHHSTTHVNIASSVRFKIPNCIEQANERNAESEDHSNDQCREPENKTVSLKQFLVASLYPVADKRRSASSAFEIENSFLSSLTVTSLEQPIMMRNNSLRSTGTGSFVSISSTKHFSPNSPNTSPLSSSGSYRENYTSSDFSRDSSSLTNDSDFEKLSFTQSSLGSPVQDRTLLENPDMSKYSKISILGLKRRFTFMAHAVFSVLIGRPVLVIGEEKHKLKVRHLVFGLANFLPSKGSSRTVVPWLKAPFSHNQLTSPGIVGIQKCPRGRDVPNSLKPYVTIFDVEDETLLAPRYDGRFLHDIFDTNTYFSSEIAYRHFILQSFSEIYSKVFLRFVKIYSQPDAEKAYSEHGIETLFSPVKSPHRKETRGDEYIVAAFVKNMEEDVLHKFSSCGNRSITTKFNTMQCTLFNNSKRKKY